MSNGSAINRCSRCLEWRPAEGGVAEPRTAPLPPAPTASGGDSKWKRIGVGIPVTFIFMSLLYGPTNSAQAVLMGIICTAGVGLIPMLFLSWAVGWLVLTVWHSFTQRRTAPKAS